MWLRICNVGNRPVVRVLLPGISTADSNRLYWGDAYPATAPVMDQLGRVTNGIQSDNYFPMCFDAPGPGPTVASTNQQVPPCPTELFAFAVDGQTQKYHLNVVHTPSGADDYVDGRVWAARGAINAAFAVFAYLQQLEQTEQAGMTPQPTYDRCDLR
jgi:hypothetical protein